MPYPASGPKNILLMLTRLLVLQVLWLALGQTVSAGKVS